MCGQKVNNAVLQSNLGVVSLGRTVGFQFQACVLWNEMMTVTEQHVGRPAPSQPSPIINRAAVSTQFNTASTCHQRGDDQAARSRIYRGPIEAAIGLP